VLTGQISTRRNGRGEAVDPAALDPESRRLVERGVREAYGLSLTEFLDDAKIGGLDVTVEDIEGAPARGVNSSNSPRPEPAVPPGSSAAAGAGRHRHSRREHAPARVVSCSHNRIGRLSRAARQ
jgi:hypothetical protein